jgi:hypothetical protein
LHNEVFCDFYYSSDIFTQNCEALDGSIYVENIGDIEEAYKIVYKNLKGKYHAEDMDR